MNGVPDARGAVAGASAARGGPRSSSELERQQERHGQRGAGGERRELAQRGRVGLPGEVHADPGGGHHRRPAGVEARPPPARSHHDSPASKSTGTSRSQSGTPKPSSIRRCRFQAWGPGWSTSNTRSREASSGRRWAKVSSPAPRMTYWPTPRPACSATRSSMKRARATMRRAEPAGAHRVHVRPVAASRRRAPPAAGRPRPRARAAAGRPGRASPATARPAPPSDPAIQSAPRPRLAMLVRLLLSWRSGGGGGDEAGRCARGSGARCTGSRVRRHRHEPAVHRSDGLQPVGPAPRSTRRPGTSTGSSR